MKFKYRITINSSGMYHNFMLGERFFTTHKDAFDFIKQAEENEAYYKVEKWVKYCPHIYGWSEIEALLTLHKKFNFYDNEFRYWEDTD